MDSKINTTTTKEQKQHDVRAATYNLLTIESGMITLCVLYLIIVFRQEKPPSPPSIAAMVEKKDITSGMGKDLCVLLRNVNYMLILGIFTLIYIIYAGLGFVINPLFGGFGYSSTSISIFGALFVLVGTISTIIIGKYLDKSKRYLCVLRVIPFAGTCIFGIGIFVIPLGYFWITMFIVVLGGAACVPIIAVGYQFGTEVSHPTQPALVLGLMMSSAQTFLFGFNFLFLELLNHNQNVLCLIVMSLFPLVAIFLSLFVKQDLRRLNSSMNMA